MQKILIYRAGDYEELKIEEFPDLIPSADEICVDIVAAGVNYADCMVRFGVYESAKKYKGWPITPGFEYSGRISKVGKNCKKYKEGDLVYGISFFGAYASQILTTEEFLYPLPQSEDLKLPYYAGFPVVFFTAYYALCQIFHLRAGAKVLIHSAAGGVGSALVQLAKMKQYQITAVVGRIEKKKYLEKLGGIEHIIATSEENLWEKVKTLHPYGLDAIFDANGFKTYQKSFENLALGGKLVCYGSHSLMPKKGGRIKFGLGLFRMLWGIRQTPQFHPFELISKGRAVAGFNLSLMLKNVELLRDVFQETSLKLNSHLLENKIHFLETTFYNFKDVARAHQKLESGKSTGKLVLKFE